MAENGGNHEANGGNHAPAMAANGGIPAQAVAQNGGNPALAMAAANAAMGNGGTHAPAMRRITETALYQLLLRMPAAEVARCRAVCRQWRDLTSTNDFRRDHHRHHYRQPVPLFFYRLDHQAVPLDPFEDPDLVRVNLRAVDLRTRASTPVIRFAHVDPALPIADPRVFRIEGSCDGILLLSYHVRLYACNPCTRHWARLPPLHLHHDIVGFYACGPLEGREYRVLYHAGLQDSDCRYWIFSLFIPDQPARYIGRPANSEAVRLVLASGISPSHEMPPVVVEESLHWRPQAGQDNSNVMVFDTVAEAFRWVPPPRRQEDDRWVQVEGDQLLEINGLLAMTLVAPTMVDVWVLQDYMGEVWMHLYQIELPVAVIDGNHGYDDEGAITAAVFAVSQERNALVQCPHILLQCDTEGIVLENYQLDDHCTILSRYMLQESLLLHGFLPMRESDANDGDPPFFQGL